MSDLELYTYVYRNEPVLFISQLISIGFKATFSMLGSMLISLVSFIWNLISLLFIIVFFPITLLLTKLKFARTHSSNDYQYQAKIWDSRD